MLQRKTDVLLNPFMRIGQCRAASCAAPFTLPSPPRP